LLQVVLQCKADVVLLQDGMTPLYAAATRGHAMVVYQLLRAGAAVDTASKVITPFLNWCLLWLNVRLQLSLLCFNNIFFKRLT
jgi:ankyrin repeat protein